MGDVNQLLFVTSLSGSLEGPVLEVGSRDYGNTQDFRALFKGADYVGIDMQAGKGVDLVLDLTDDFESLDRRLGGRRFGTLICMSVLEHCRDPFRMARNIEALLAEGGNLVIGAPFVWELHGFPDDYWRFTPSGIRVLFPSLDFSAVLGAAFTGRKGDAAPLDGTLFCIKFSSNRPEPRFPTLFKGYRMRSTSWTWLSVAGPLAQLRPRDPGCSGFPSNFRTSSVSLSM